MALQEEFEVQGNWLFKYRGVLPFIIFFMGLYLYIQTEIHPEDSIWWGTPYKGAYQMGCLLVSMLGLIIRIFTVGYTPANTSGRNTKEQLADTINTTGIYSVIRHPLYVGNFFTWLGIAMLTANLWFIIAFILLYWLYYERIMFAEEQFLRKKFGQPYLFWSGKTPAIIPKLSQYVKPKLPFSWKKVLKNEKMGIPGLFVIFFMFDYLGRWIQKSNDYNQFLLFACIISLVLYLVLKILKSQTNILNEAGR